MTIEKDITGAEKIITSTWLPVFPGFYGTLFDGENMYEQETDYIDEHVQPEELATAMKENLYNSNAGTKLWKDYIESTAKQCVKIIEQELKKLEFVESIAFEEICSPREYNFSNDSINVVITFSAENLQKIRQFISAHYAQWRDYLKNSYTSRDGFISHHANDPGAEEWFADNAVNDTHNAGALLTFLCGENNINEETLYYGCESDVGLDYEAYKKECVKMGWYVPKNICLDWFKALIPQIKKKYLFRIFKDSYAKQFIFDTPKQRYIFAVSKEEISNQNFIIKRYFKVFIFGRLKNEKKKNP